jgi:hypothetical protein
MKSKINWQKNDIAVIKEGWDQAGKGLEVLGPAVYVEQWWVPVLHPDEEDPSFYKEASLRRE